MDFTTDMLRKFITSTAKINANFLNTTQRLHSLRRFNSSNSNQQKNIPPRFKFDSTSLKMLAATTVGSFALLYIFKDYLRPRERLILQPSIDLKKNPHHGYIVDQNDFEYVGPKPAGELSGFLVKHTKTGKVYLMKGASSKRTLIEEFLISTFLQKMRPGEQPSSLIMEHKLPGGQARLFTLSEIMPNSMDLKMFVMDANYKSKLASKPLIGFELALAGDLLFQKQADMKFSNYIVIETNDAFIVASIDHEMTGSGIKAKRILTNNLHELIRPLRDIDTLTESDDPQQYAAATTAGEFTTYAMQYMDPHKVEEFYEKVARFDIKEMKDIIDYISGENGVIDANDATAYLQEIAGITNAARIYCQQKSDHTMSPGRLKL